MRDSGAQHNLGGLRIKPPVKFRVVQIGVTRHIYLSGHSNDLLNQRNNGRILSNRKGQVGWRRDLQDGNLVRELVAGGFAKQLELPINEKNPQTPIRSSRIWGELHFWLVA